MGWQPRRTQGRAVPKSIPHPLPLSFLPLPPSLSHRSTALPSSSLLRGLATARITVLLYALSQCSYFSATKSGEEREKGGDRFQKEGTKVGGDLLSSLQSKRNERKLNCLHTKQDIPHLLPSKLIFMFGAF